ncbi:MAG: hypothetical protein U5R49_09675 [Deltaproteobacteria bacterium]|nr:hypothetical protein [Deltaproteobacteria bacterium]
MKRSFAVLVLVVFVFAGVSFAGAAPDKIVIGHPACLSGKYAKAGEQAVGGIKACIDWVNNVKGGVEIGGKKVPLEYKFYDCESKKRRLPA